MNRTVLISGASKGIGRALAERLATQGHKVIGIARTGDASFPGELRTVDLSDRDATSTALQDISSTTRIDAVVNNVGLIRPRTLEQVTLDALDAVLDVNLRTAIQLTQAALTGMREQGWGRVVNIASLVALGAPAAHRVCRGQGGTDQLHPGVGVRVGHHRHHGQCRSARTHRNRAVPREQPARHRG